MLSIHMNKLTFVTLKSFRESVSMLQQLLEFENCYYNIIELTTHMWGLCVCWWDHSYGVRPWALRELYPFHSHWSQKLFCLLWRTELLQTGKKIQDYTVLNILNISFKVQIIWNMSFNPFWSHRASIWPWWHKNDKKHIYLYFHTKVCQNLIESSRLCHCADSS